MSGLITDPAGAMVRGAQITLTNTATGVVQKAQTNDSGFYSIPYVDAGQYSLAIESTGFKRVERTHITVNVAQAITINTRLQIGETSQSVTVDGSGAQINTTDASVSTVVDRQFVQNIPLNGRSFQSLTTLVPGSTLVSSSPGYSGELSINGQRTEENYFTVDGIAVQLMTVNSANPGEGLSYGGTTSALTALGTTQSMISVDALEEFRATTSTFSAEYGRTPGGQFSFNSRAGTNALHGSAYDYLRNDALDASSWFNGYVNSPPLQKPAERQNDFGGTLGGPLWIPRLYNGHDRTFFFFSYEGLRLTAPSTYSAGTPTVALRNAAAPALRPFLNAFPVPTDQQTANAVDGMATYFATFSNPSSLDVVGVRIDHSFNDRWKIFGRYADSSSDSVAKQFPQLTSQSSRMRGVTLGSTNTFNSRAANELRFNFTRASSQEAFELNPIGGATPFELTSFPGISEPNAYLLFYIGYGPTGRLAILPRHTVADQINIVDGFDMVLGRHSLKFGLDYRRIADTFSLPSVEERPYFFSRQALIQNQTDSLSLAVSSTLNAEPVNQNLSLYAQDNWKVSSRLNLSAGVRWEFNPPPHDAAGNNPYTATTADLATTQLAPRGTPLWKTTYANFAPRLGLAYQLHENPGYQTVFRAGAGLYYDLGYPQAAEGYEGVGFSSMVDYTGNAFPLTQQQVQAVPPVSLAAPYNNSVFAFDTNLKLPFSVQWNAALQQGLGDRQSLTVSYVASVGRRLFAEATYDPSVNGNKAFSLQNLFYLTQNQAFSSYNSLQAQFQRNLSHGLQVLASYTWSHSIDNQSNNFFAYGLIRADSDFDLRNNFQAAATYDTPSVALQNSVFRAIFNGWGGDLRVSSRSSLPVDIQSGNSFDTTTGTYLYYHPNRVAGQPLYSHLAGAPGGRVINYQAFTVPYDKDGNALQGNAGRNVARGFSATQADITLRREFPLWDAQAKLQFRIEAFNVLNHPIFGTINNWISYGPPNLAAGTGFGIATTTQNAQLGGLNSLYQVGGPRSLQVALRLHF